VAVEDVVDPTPGGVTADVASSAFSLLEFAGSVEDAARQADLVIEAVPEELESKIEIFTLLDKICRPGTILASHISTLSITEISRVTYRARNCVGMHFAELGKGLEIVRGQETDAETVATAVEVGRRMGREVVVVGEGQTSA
jgi:3-hydroxybutyryl-CoA dehydrogenase